MEQASMDYEAPLMPCGCILLCHFLTSHIEYFRVMYYGYAS